jgi:hypothetical protein
VLIDCASSGAALFKTAQSTSNIRHGFSRGSPAV